MEPTTPAAPVPEDHVDTTFLQKNKTPDSNFRFPFEFSSLVTYLLKYDEYDMNFASPMPPLAEVKMIPNMAIHSALAKATIRNPLAEKVTATII